MKRYYFFLLFMLIGTVSCSDYDSDSESPERVAEEALKAIGSGRYAGGLVGESQFTLDMCKLDLFTRALEYNDKALEYIKGGTYSHQYFQIDDMFENWTLIDKSEGGIDLYHIVNYKRDRNKYIDRDAWERDSISYFGFLESFKDDIVKYDNENIAVLRPKDKNIPIYFLRYKIDGYRIATVVVIKDSGEYRVADFYWSK